MKGLAAFAQFSLTLVTGLCLVHALPLHTATHAHAGTGNHTHISSDGPSAGSPAVAAVNNAALSAPVANGSKLEAAASPSETGATLYVLVNSTCSEENKPSENIKYRRWSATFSNLSNNNTACSWKHSGCLHYNSRRVPPCLPGAIFSAASQYCSGTDSQGEKFPRGICTPINVDMPSVVWNRCYDGQHAYTQTNESVVVGFVCKPLHD